MLFQASCAFEEVCDNFYFWSCKETIGNRFWRYVLIESTLAFMSLTKIHVLQIPSDSSLPFLDSFNHLFWSSRARACTPRTVFRCTKFLKSVYNIVHRVFSHLRVINNLLVCPSRAMKLNYFLSFAHCFESLMKIVLMLFQKIVR